MKTAMPAVSRREQTNRGRSERLAEEGMVLLKNNGVLPLEPGKIALFGNGARHTVIGGTGSGSVNVRDSINIEEGLCHAGFTIMSSSWLDRYDRYCAEQKEAYAAPLRKAIQSGDGSAVMQLFTNPYREPAASPMENEDMDETDAETALMSFPAYQVRAATEAQARVITSCTTRSLRLSGHWRRITGTLLLF